MREGAEPRQIELLMKTGERRIVNAFVIGNWAWHKSPGLRDEDSGDWSVTHTPAGCSVPAHTTREDDMAALADLLDLRIPSGAHIDVIRAAWPSVVLAWMDERRLRPASAYSKNLYVPR